VVDAGDPRNAAAAHLQGFLSRDGMPPRELLAAGRAEVTSYGGTLLDGTVVDIDVGFQVQLTDGQHLQARRIVIATGLHDEVPDIAGVTERWGRDLLHCPYCHGYEVRDQPLGILGGTPDAVQHALLLRQWSADVLFFAHTSVITAGEAEQLAARGIPVVTGAVARLVVRDDRLHGIELVDGTVVPRAAVFVRPRLMPNADLLTRLGCAVDERGWAVRDGVGRTSVPGVWVAGNAADPRAQVITAAGQGSAVAIDINADLADEDVQHALAISAHTHRSTP
jgi:thioredoxin reductase